MNLFSISNCRLCAMFLVPSTALVAALLFAVHPIHTEAVSVSLLTFYSNLKIKNIYTK